MCVNKTLFERLDCGMHDYYAEFEAYYYKMELNKSIHCNY